MYNHINIVIPVFNATFYVKKCLDSIQNTQGVDYSITVVDNDSDKETKQLLHKYFLSKKISILCNLESNRLFAKANNIGVKISPEHTNKILLLNSDVEILDPQWLCKLLHTHQRGATSIGVVPKSRQFPARCDGYCFLIDRDLYENYWLDEYYPWWWSITKIQSQLLNDNFLVQAIKDRSNIIKHYKHKSGNLRVINQAKNILPKQDINFEQNTNNLKIIYNL